MEKIRVTIIHTGSTIIDDSIPFESATPPLFPKLALLGLFRSRKNRISVPVSAYLIEHPKGKVLIDTGFHKRVREHPVSELTPIHFLINKPVQGPGEAVDEQLLAMGIRPADLDYVVLSHMHTDHAGGVRQFAQAKTLLVSAQELAHARTNRGEYVASHWNDLPLQTFPLSPSQHGPVQLAHDLFGDDSVVFISVPGHTPGQVATLIQNNGKFLLLTSDCGYARKSWEQMILPGVTSDREAALRSLQWVAEMSRRTNCIDCLATHETEITSRVYEF